VRRRCCGGEEGKKEGVAVHGALYGPSRRILDSQEHGVFVAERILGMLRR
jgi:hypothetical protein